MSDCGCDKAKKDLEEYLHREHMANCPDCAREHRVGVVLRDTVRRACTEAAPEDLRTQVMEKLRAIQATH
jgi:anti-sigma factor (TIGR02949 family)